MVELAIDLSASARGSPDDADAKVGETGEKLETGSGRSLSHTTNAQYVRREKSQTIATTVWTFRSATTYFAC